MIIEVGGGVYKPYKQGDIKKVEKACRILAIILMKN